MSRTGCCSSIVGGQNHSIYFPVQLSAQGAGLTMTWTHGVGQYAYYVALHAVSGVSPITGSGVDISLETANLLTVEQPNVNQIVVESGDTGGEQMFIMEAKFEENTSELDLVGVERSGADLYKVLDPPVVIS